MRKRVQSVFYCGLFLIWLGVGPVSLEAQKISDKEKTIGKDSIGKTTFSVRLTLKQAFPWGSIPLETHSYSFFILAYSEPYEQAACVAYLNTREKVKSQEVERSSSFREDKNISTGSALSADYKNTDYDRGHLCPAADVRFDPQAMKESFLMSNVSPQTPSFNRGFWKVLEDKVREWTITYDSLLILTGPVLSEIADTIGTQNRIAVPAWFYKIVIKTGGDEPRAAAFMLPNENVKDDLYNYHVSIDFIEEKTGLDFFPTIDHLPCIRHLERSVDWCP